MRLVAMRRRFLPLLLSVALLPISAIVTASTAQAAGTKFSCDASFYQLSNGSLFKLNTSADLSGSYPVGSYVQVGSGSQSGLDGAGWNPADDFIYANVAGTALKKIASDGSITAAGSITGSLTNTDGGDFLTNDQMLMTGANSATLQLLTLNRSGGIVSGATASTISLTGSGFSGASDIAVVPTSGTTSTAYALKGNTLTIFTLSSSNPSTATYITKPIVGLQNSTSGIFSALWVDPQGDLYAWDGVPTPSATTSALYEISASELASGNSFFKANDLEETNVASAVGNDGANCKTAPSAFAPQFTTAPTVASITANSASVTGYLTTKAFAINPLGSEGNLKVCYNSDGVTSTTFGSSYGLLTSATCFTTSTTYPASSTEVPFTISVTGLSGSTKYYYQVQGTNTPITSTTSGVVNPFTGYGVVQSFTTIAAPSFTSIAPAAGPLGGGTVATITGVSFSGATSVTIGGVAAASFTVNSSTSISVTTPVSSAVGPVDVVITTPSGVVTGTGAFTYQATVTYHYNGPGVVSPTTQSSAVSTTLTNPSPFTRTNAVFLGWNTDPAGTGTNYANGATYAFTTDLDLYAIWMTVTSITPSSGTAIGGTSVTISGTNFMYNAGPVTASGANINGVAITSFTVVDQQTITGVAPAGISTGVKDVTVTSSAGTATASLVYTYTAEPQTVSITSTAPSTPTFGGTYTVTATGSPASITGDPITFSIPSSSSAVCTVSGAVVTFIKIGSCTVNADRAGTAQYLAAPTDSQTFTVLPKALTISAYNQTKTFGAADPSNSFSTSGLRSPDTVTGVTFTRAPGESVGTYAITITPASETFGSGSASNYTITFNPGTLTIDPTTVATAGANGSISPPGTSTATYNATQTITITPNVGYHVLDVTVTNVDTSTTIDAGAVTSYSFVNNTANHTINATFAINTYTLNYNAGLHGQVETGLPLAPVSNPYVVNWHTDGPAVTAVPDLGYQFTSWSDGVLTASRQDLSVSANHTVSARFAIAQYSITTSVGAGGGGTITASSTVNYGDTQDIFITPNSGYFISDVTDNGVSLGAQSSVTLSNISQGHTIVATFASLSTILYTLTYSTNVNGTISQFSTQTVGSGNSGTPVSAPAEAGYHFSSWSDGNLNHTRTETNVKYNANYIANYTSDLAAPATYVVTTTAGANGSVNQSGSKIWNSGDTVLVTIKANTGYHIASVVVDGGSPTTVASLQFSNISADHTVAVTFAVNPTIYTLTYNAGSHGTISGLTSQSITSGGSGSQVAAVPNSGYQFVEWQEGGVTTGTNPLSAARTDTGVSASHTYTAIFSQVTFTLTYNSNGNGSVSPSGSQSGLAAGASGVAVTATPANSGYLFSSWSDGNTSPTRTDVVGQSDATYTANFVPTGGPGGGGGPFTITATVSGTGGSITPTSSSWNSGDAAIIQMAPSTGYYISDVLIDGTTHAAISSSYSFAPITANHTIQVTFSNMYTLTYNTDGHGSVTTGSASQPVAYSGSGTAVSVTPSAGCTFTTWSDGVATATRTDTNITGNITVTAMFTCPTTYTLNYVANPHGAIGANATQVVNSGASGLAVTANADSGYQFTSWSDGVLTATRTDTNVQGDITYTANFSPVLAGVTTYTVTSSVTGTGGSVSPAGAKGWNAGDVAGVYIIPSSGYHIASVVSDSGAPTTNSSVFYNNIGQNHTVVATFAQNVTTYTLTYLATSTGSVDPTTANQTVTAGTNGAAVTATALTGYHFTSWSDGSTNNPRTDLNVSSNITVTARFAINTYTITASAGSGGSITPPGATVENYGDTQDYSISSSTGYHIASVTVTNTDTGATVDTSAIAVGANSDSTATFTFSNIQAHYTIAVAFAINTYTLTYTAGNNGTLAGFTIQSPISYGYGGTAVTPQPNTGYYFTTWSDGSTSNPRIDLNVTSNISVTAHFAIYTYQIVSSIDSSDPSSVVTGGTISPLGTSTQNYGATRGYSISANAGFHINWIKVDGAAVLTGQTGTNSNTSASYTFSNITAGHTIVVSFANNQYTLTYLTSGGGSITPSGNQVINYGQAGALVTENTPTGYSFVNWTDVVGGSTTTTTGPTQQVTNVTANHTITAHFAINTFTINASSTGNGSVSPNGTSTSSFGSSPTITITPSAGYQVSGVLVDGVSVGAVSSYTFTSISANHTLVGSFSPTPYTITASSSDTLKGTVSPNGVTTTSSYHQSVTITLTPALHYQVTSVTVDGVDHPQSATTYTFTNISASHTLVANFALVSNIVTYAVSPSSAGRGTISGTASQSIGYGQSGTSVTAQANAGNRFYYWSDGATNATRTDSNITSPANYYAVFGPNTTAVLTYIAGPGGTVSIASQVVTIGQAATTVTAVANAGYTFVGWNDGVLTGSRTDLNVLADHTYTATFSSSLNVTYAADLHGTIQGNANQTISYGTNGTSVTAQGNTGYHFLSWSDGGSSATRFESNVITNLSFTATFTLNTYTLSAIAGANGSISSPGLTTANFGDNKSYTITPNPGYQIASVLVDGNNVGIPNSYTFSAISAGHSIQVSFALLGFTLTGTAGPGGSINPSGSVLISYGQSATATFSPASGFHIADVQIDGISQGVITTYTFSAISSNHTASVTFLANAANSHTVTYTTTGNGSISGVAEQNVPDGGSTTTVTAIPAKGSTFDSWSDGSTNPVRIDTKVKSDLVFSAKFTTPSYIINALAGPNGSVTPAGNTSELYGSNLQVTFRPNAGFHVFNVQLDGNSIGIVGSYTFTNITAGHAISVTFAADATETGPHSTPTPTPAPTKKPTPSPTPTPTSKPTPTPSTAPIPTPSGTPQPGPTDGPLVKEGTDGSKSTINGTDDPTKESLLPNGNGVEVAGKDWKIQISSDKKSVYGIALPSSIKIFLIRGVNATTSGSGFLPGTIAKVYLFSTGIYLGQALVGPDGSFSTTFPVAAATTLGYHVMQVEGTSYDNKKRTASVGLEVINKPAKGLVYLGTIYYGLDVSILTPTNIAKLAAIFTTIQNNGYKKIWIYGYTDIQNGVDNKLLSKHRSIRIAEMLNAILPQSIVGFKYFGPANPKDKAKTEAAFAKNRRSEIWGQL